MTTLLASVPNRRAVLVARFEDDEDDLRASLGSLRLHEKRLVLLPVNNNPYADRAGGSHWSLLVCARDGATVTLHHLDSSRPTNAAAADEVGRRFWPLLVSDGSSSSSTATPAAYPGVVSSAGCPQQTNNSDCGVMLLLFAEAVATGATAPTAPAIPDGSDPTTACAAHRAELRARIERLAREASSKA